MVSDTPIDPFAPVKLGPITLANRIIKAATFEGMAPNHLVTDSLIEFHRAVVAGGVAMTTLAYCAVSADGQGAPGEIVVNDRAAPGLRRFADAMHQLGAAASIQLGHSGPVAAGTGHRGLAPSRVFALQAMRFTRAATASEIARITADFARAARLTVDCGFDAVELHFGHGYLISSFLSPKLNKRNDKWGGTIANRARFARQVAIAVREAVGQRAAVIAKFNMADGVSGGLWLDESIAAAQLLDADGALDALELTGGSSFQNPMFLFRGDIPVQELAQAFPPTLRLGFKLASPWFMREYAFEEAYFLPYARQFRDALKLPLILLGGVNRLETVHRALAEGFSFVALGRALLREPDLISRWHRQETQESMCIHCNKCVATIYTGTHCVLVASEERPGFPVR